VFDWQNLIKHYRQAYDLVVEEKGKE